MKRKYNTRQGKQIGGSVMLPLTGIIKKDEEFNIEIEDDKIVLTKIKPNVLEQLMKKPEGSRYVINCDTCGEVIPNDIIEETIKEYGINKIEDKLKNFKHKDMGGTKCNGCLNLEDKTKDKNERYDILTDERKQDQISNKKVDEEIIF